MRFLRTLPATAALLLASAGLLAQQPPPPSAARTLPAPPVAGASPPPPGAPGAVPPLADPAAATTALSGRIQQWLVNPNGDVDGMLLADGMQVNFPPHLSAELLQAVRLGDPVRITGWRSPQAPVVRAVSLAGTASGRQVVDAPPGAGTPPPAPREPGALVQMGASGHVARLLYTDGGDPNGVVLDTGTIVRFPPHLGAALAPDLRPGSPVVARGWGSRSPQGSALEATALGDSEARMRDLWAGPADGPRGLAPAAPAPGLVPPAPPAS